MKYPIEIRNFAEIIEGGYVYVDKTDIIYDLVQEHICLLSRPPKFGKSLLLSTLEAYFHGLKELFQGLKIDKMEQDWMIYPIFHIDFSNETFHCPDELTEKLECCLSEWEDIYGKKSYCVTLGDRFQFLLEQARRQTGNDVVVLIDAYDKPFLDMNGKEAEKTVSDILGGFYGVFKSADSFLRFVFLTGVTNYKPNTIFSGLNQVQDIGMHYRYDAICGFTEKELDNYFAEPIKRIARQYHCSEASMISLIKKRYGGYHFSERIREIINPFSLLHAFKENRIDNYWFSYVTSTYPFKNLEPNNINLQKLLDYCYSSSSFSDYHPDEESPIPILYQSGFLTIKEYDLRYWVYTLDYPNDEVRSGFRYSLRGTREL